MQSTATTAAEYFEALPDDRRAALSAVRERITSAAPGAVEAMQYGMPTYAVNGTVLFGLAAQKQYLALYVIDKGVMDAHRPAFAHLDVGKGCVRFRRLDDLPLDTVSALVRESVDRLHGGATQGC